MLTRKNARRIAALICALTCVTLAVPGWVGANAGSDWLPLTGGDTDPPQTAIASGPAGPTNDATPTFTFTVDQSGVTFECRVDNGPFAACASPRTTSTLSTGQHVFRVRARDAAGNVDPTPASRNFRVDTVKPETTISSGPSAPTRDATPTFVFTSSEAGSSFECRVDGAAFAACASPRTTAALSDGAHTFRVRARDAAGNIDATPATTTFRVDTTPPQTTIGSGPSGPTTDRTPTFAFASSETGSTFECRLDGGAFAACTSPRTTAALSDGVHTFRVRARDALGNTDATPALRTFTVAG